MNDFIIYVVFFTKFLLFELQTAQFLSNLRQKLTILI